MLHGYIFLTRKKLMMKTIFKEIISTYSLKNKKVATIIVSRTRKQRCQQLTNILLSILSVEMMFGLLYLLFDFVNSNQISISIIFSLVGLVCLESIMVLNWLFLNSKFSPIEKWKVSALLKLFPEENDILRKHKSEIDTTQSVRWEYWIDNGLIFLKLYHGGHVPKGKLEEIPTNILSFFIKETRDEWFLEDKNLADGYVKVVLSHKPDKSLYIKGREDFIESKTLKIRLTERLNWTLSQTNALIVGPSNSGKTTLLKYLILAFLINNKKNEVYTIDGKSAYLSNAMRHIGEVATTGQQAFDMISKVEAIMEERYAEINQNSDDEADVTHNEKFGQGNILLVIDEYLALATEMQAEDKLKKPADRLFPQFNAKLLKLIVKCRQASIMVVVSGQLLPTSILSSESRDSLGLRIALGRISQSQSTEIFNIGKSELPSVDSSKREGVIYLDGIGLEHPITFKTPFYDDSRLPFKGALRVLKSERS